MKKILALITILAVMALTALMGCQITGSNDGDNTVYDEAASVFTVDINPGVRVYLAANETVIEVEATNEDGKVIIEGLALMGDNCEEALDKIVNRAIEEGFIEESEPSVLVTVEKESEDYVTDDATADGAADDTAEGATDGDSTDAENHTLMDKVCGGLDRVFGKHGKYPRVISQKLDKIKNDVNEAVKDFAEKHEISVGKAHVIDKILGEFPELEAEDLAKLDMGKLGLLLGETGDDVHKHFEKFEKALEENLIGKEAALAKAIEGLAADGITVTSGDVLDLEIRLSRADGKMVYDVEFVYGDKEYEFEIDAELGNILKSEFEARVEFDVDEEIDKFFDKGGEFFDEMLEKLEKEHEENLDHWREEQKDYRDEILDAMFGKGEANHPEHPGSEDDVESKDEPIGRTEAIKASLDFLNLTREDVIESRVKIHHGENGALIIVKLTVSGGDKYEIVLEAYSASLIKVSKNGESVEAEAPGASDTEFEQSDAISNDNGAESDDKASADEVTDNASDATEDNQ